MLTGTVAIGGMGLIGLMLLLLPLHDCIGPVSFLMLQAGVRVASVLMLEGFVSRLACGNSKSAMG